MVGCGPAAEPCAGGVLIVEVDGSAAAVRREGSLVREICNAAGATEIREAKEFREEVFGSEELKKIWANHPEEDGYLHYETRFMEGY